MALTPKQLAELVAIEEWGRVRPETPDQQAVVDELFDHGLLIIYPANGSSEYGLTDDAKRIVAEQLRPVAQSAQAPCPTCGRPVHA